MLLFLFFFVLLTLFFLDIIERENSIQPGNTHIVGILRKSTINVVLGSYFFFTRMGVVHVLVNIGISNRKGPNFKYKLQIKVVGRT